MLQRLCVLQRVAKPKNDLIQHMYIPLSHTGEHAARCLFCLFPTRTCHKSRGYSGKESRRKEDERGGGVRASSFSLSGCCETLRVELRRGWGGVGGGHSASADIQYMKVCKGDVNNVAAVFVTEHVTPAQS